MKKRSLRKIAIISVLLVTTATTSYEIYKIKRNNLLLISAVSTGNFDTAKDLLALGANPNCRDNDGNPVILLVVNAPITAQIHGISTQGSQTITHYKNHYETVRLLVEKGADPNAKNQAGETPLNQAMGCSNSELVDFLVKNGAKVTK